MPEKCDSSQEIGPYFVKEKGADLEYWFSNGSWHIDSIDSKVPGGGKRIIREFAKRVGKDQPVFLGCVIEHHTRAKLHELGYLTQVDETKIPLELTDQNVFKDLKMVRVLTGGGIIVEKVVIKPWEEQFQKDPSLDEDGCRVNISIFGKTA